jgi:hypothetical protein
MAFLSYGPGRRLRDAQSWRPESEVRSILQHSHLARFGFERVEKPLVDRRQT